MIYSVTGKLIHTESDLAVIQCGGVGYACRTTLNTLAQIRDKQNEVTLLTYLNVREDAVELFGFYSNEELYSFKLLTSVSGVGPKVALSILSSVNPSSFALAVATEDSKAFTKIKGVGPKLAQRIVLELKDKITKENAFSAAQIPDFEPVRGNADSSEAISALVVLGYSQSEAAAAISKLDSSLSVEEKIKQGLKALSSFK